MAGYSAFSKVEHTIGDSKHPSDELSRDLGRFFGVSADKMTQNMVEYQFHDSAPAYVYGPLQPSLLRSEKLLEIAPDMLYLPLQSIHVAQALFHAVVALALEITQRKDIIEEDLIECIELRQLGEKLQDIFDLMESHITKQEPSYQSLSNWQAGLDEVFERLCKGGYGREEIRQSRDFLQSLKRSDEEQYTRSRLLTGTPNLHRVRTAVPDLPIDQIDRKVDGIRLLSLDGERPGSTSQLRILQEHVERGVVSEISSDAETTLASEYTVLVDIPIEVSLTDEPTAKFTGNYSDVYIGRFRNEKVAVKIIKHIRGTSLEAMQQTFTRERRLWASLNHPNIVPFYGYAVGKKFGSIGALISPWYDNGDATKFLATHGKDMDILARSTLWMGVIAGVHYLHTYSPIIVHGDLKPANILIDDQRNARLCDFGISRALIEAGTSGLAATSAHTSTMPYLSRELISSEEPRTPTTASDVYALACIGLEFIYLQRPYASRKNTFWIFQDINNNHPPAVRPSSLSESLIPLWNLFESCWALEPASRPHVENVMTSHKQWHAAHIHTFEQKDQEKGIFATSSLGTVNVAGRQPNISMAETGDTEALVEATITAHADGRQADISTPESEDPEALVDTTVIARADGRHADISIPIPKDMEVPIEPNRHYPSSNAYDPAEDPSNVSMPESGNTKPLIRAIGNSFDIIASLFGARSDHNAVRGILDRVRNLGAKYVLSVFKSVETAQSGHVFANTAQDLCIALGDEENDYSDEHIHCTVTEMQKIAQEAYASAEITSNMFRTHKMELMTIRASTSETLGDIKTKRAQIISKDKATSKASSWKRMTDSMMGKGGNTSSSLQIAKTAIYLPAIAVTASGAQIFKKQAEGLGKMVASFEEALAYLEPTEKGLELLTDQMDVITQFWLEVHTVQEAIRATADGLLNDNILQMEMRSLKREWKDIGDDYKTYQSALITLLDNNPHYKEIITPSRMIAAST